LGLIAGRLGRWFAEDFGIQGEVIIPLIDVAGNEGRVDGEAFHFGLMGLEEAFQAEVWVEVFEFGAVLEIDQDRVAAAVLPGWDD
jgi:hypothetical protein